MAGKLSGLAPSVLPRLLKAQRCNKLLIPGSQQFQTISRTLISNPNPEFSKHGPCTSFSAQQLPNSQSRLLLSGPSSFGYALSNSQFQPFGQLEQRRFYQAALKPRLICPGCYFVWRHGRKYVECSDHPRHKQMKKVATRKMWKEDYTTGNWIKALDFHKVHYRQAERNVDRKSMSHSWGVGKLGTAL